MIIALAQDSYHAFTHAEIDSQPLSFLSTLLHPLTDACGKFFVILGVTIEEIQCDQHNSTYLQQPTLWHLSLPLQT